MPEAEPIAFDLNLRSAEVFEQVVRKHIHWVSAAARRRLGDTHLADDAAQAVFLLLHRKAPRFVGEGALVNWLHRAVFHVSRTAIRSTQRRKRREQTAFVLQQQRLESNSSAEWRELAPVLDELILKLPERDREIILLRYYEQLSHADVARAFGITEDAANKRTQRALERLRQFAERRGMTMTATALAAALLSYAAPPAPAGVISTTLAGSMASGSSLLTIGSSSFLSWTTLTIMNTQTKLLIGIASLLLVTLMGGVLAWKLNSDSGHAGASVASTVPAPATQTKIKVGVVLSDFTATGPTWVDAPYGHWWPTKIVREELRDSRLDLYPVIDPGTAKSNQIPEMCARYFPGKTPIECNDPAAMSQIQVFIATGQANLLPEMIEGLTHAVRDEGKSLIVRMFFGGTTPSFTPEVLALNGLTDGGYGFGGSRDLEAEVIAAHPILSDFPVGTTIKFQANGNYGAMNNGQPLLRLPDQSGVHPVTDATTILPKGSYEFFPMYLAEFGKGKIVNCAWSITPKTPDGVNPSARITTKAIKWLADGN